MNILEWPLAGAYPLTFISIMLLFTGLTFFYNLWLMFKVSPWFGLGLLPEALVFAFWVWLIPAGYGIGG